MVADDPSQQVKAVRVRILGRVQRVGFRHWTVQQAMARGVDGWVRNRSDGTVEAVFVGSPAAVEEMLATCAGGPPMALVNSVIESNVDASERDALVGKGFNTRQSE